MADENKPTAQQSQDAVHLDSMTSLQQPTETDQAVGGDASSVRADAVVAPSPAATPDSPSFYLPDTNLTNAPPVESQSDATSEEAEAEAQEMIADSEAVEGLTIGGVDVQVTGGVVETTEGESSSDTGESAVLVQMASADNQSLGTGARGRLSTAPVGTVEAEVAEGVVEPTAATESVIVTEPLVATEPVTVPQVGETVPAPAPVLPAPDVGLGIVSLLSSAAVGMSEGDEVLTTSGMLVVTDADAVAATVVPQTATEGEYGVFSIDAAGAWTYMTDGALDSLSSGEVVTETFNVVTTDGGSATVTVTITGTNDAAVLSSASVTLSEENAPLSTSGTLTISDVDSAQTFDAQTNTAGTYGK
ncbi:VCBS domain-containing protein, partial [Zwartia sp.]|uniref:VCBS domain-containing protein n=1 Tax=Zwartia sp. TaxID=2978004 RepID=UPI002718AE64